MMMPAFTDASSAILLHKADLFESFSKTVTLVMAQSVFDEVSKPGYPGVESFNTAQENDWLIVQSPDKNKRPHTGYPPENLGKGEKETLYLFLENNHGFIVTDDGKAARWCHRHHLPFINALLVPKIFCYAGQMTEKDCLNKMNTLCKIGRYSEKVKMFAFGCTSEDLSFIFLEQSNGKKPCL